MPEVTHRYDRDTGRLVQLVTPERLRQILRAQGENLSRPPDFDPDDEWDAGVGAGHGGAA